MRTLRLFTAAMLAMMLMQVQAQKKSNVLYESPNYVIGTETPTWDETLQKNSAIVSDSCQCFIF